MTLFYSQTRRHMITDIISFLSYTYYFTQAVTRGLFIGFIGTHVHVRQVMSMFTQRPTSGPWAVRNPR